MTSPVVTRQINPQSTTGTPDYVYSDIDMEILYPYYFYYSIFIYIIYAVIIVTVIGSIIGGIILFIKFNKKKEYVCPKCGGKFKYKKKRPLRCPFCLANLYPPESP